MRSEREAAIVVGLLYIVATVAGVLSVVVLGSSLSGPEVFKVLGENQSQVLAGALLNLIMALAVAGVAFMIYPVLKQDADTTIKKGLAVWYLGTRITEGSTFLVGILGFLSLSAVARDYASTGGADAGQAALLVSAMTTASNQAFVLGQSVFCVGAVMLYSLLYMSQRVPRWLSIWGLIGAPLMLLAGFETVLSGDPNSTISTFLYAPLAIQEMVFALWLIFRGFKPSEGRASDDGLM